MIYFDIAAAVVKFKIYLLYPGMTESGCASVYFWSGKYTRNIISGQKLLLNCQKQCSTKNRQYLVNSEVNLQRLRTLKCILCVSSKIMRPRLLFLLFFSCASTISTLMSLPKSSKYITSSGARLDSTHPETAHTSCKLIGSFHVCYL